MTPTKDQQAQEYAEKKMHDVYSEEWDSEYVKDLIEQAHIDGYTAGEQSMWRSVEEGLPEDNILVVVWIFGSAVLTDFREDGKWHYQGVRFWMPLPKLPSLPDINTEKK